MTRYDAISPEANIEMHIDGKNPHISEQDSTYVSADYDAFVAHKWRKIDTPAKRIRIPRNAINVNKLGNVFAIIGRNEKAAVDEVSQENTEPVEKSPREFPRSETMKKLRQCRTARQFLTPSGASR